MKQSRRHELKTNELSVYLQQLYEAAAQHATYLIGGVVVVILVLVIGLMVYRNQHRAWEDAWKEYAQLDAVAVEVDPSLLDRARALADEYGQDDQLGPAVLQKEATLANRLAMSLSADRQKARRIELLQEARRVYERLLAEFGDRPVVAARARIGLAGVIESLALAGEGELEQVRTLYGQLVEGEANPYQALARERLENLDERFAKLEVVASRPAEEPLATQPAAAATSAEEADPFLTPATAPAVELITPLTPTPDTTPAE